MRMLLTYKTHLIKPLFIEWAGDRFKNQGITFIRLAHETGDEECPYEHTHVVIEIGKACNFKDARCLDYENIHPHIKKLPNKKALNDAKGYIAKEDPDNSDLKSINTPIYTQIRECKTVHEALEKFVESPSDALGVIALHSIGNDGNYRRRNRVTEDVILRNWQKELDAMLEVTPNDRDIVWIYDTVGNTGKSWYSKYKCLMDSAKYRRCSDMGTNRDAATIIEGELKSGWEAWGLFINLARQCENHSRMYKYMECIKDGSMTTQKYQGKNIEFDEPHIIVFANWPPIVRELSLDRWKIYEISEDTLKPIDKYTLLKGQEAEGLVGSI